MFLYMNIFYLDGKLKIQLNKKKKQEKLISFEIFGILKNFLNNIFKLFFNFQ